jgi:hypothetical protein
VNSGRHDRAWTLGGAAVLVAVSAAGLTTALGLGPSAPPYRAAAVVAAGICLSGAVGAWLLARLGDRLASNSKAGRHGLAVAAGLGGIALRLAPPLVMLAWLRGGGAARVPDGLDRVLLGLYLSLLATDILLTIIGRPGSAAGRGANRAN